jgi:chromosome partitioning protein
VKTIAILSQKGGTSKTTLALHLAVEAEAKGFPSVVLDLDPQASSAGWKDTRKEETPAVVSIQSTRLTPALKFAEQNGAALAFLDTAPHSADAAMAAAEAADLILIPCRAGILDLRAIASTARIAKIAGKPTFAILTQAPVRAPRLVEDAIEAIRQHGLTTAPVVMHQRSAYAHSLTGGLTAQEYERGGKASEEVGSLLAWVVKLLSM